MALLFLSTPERGAVWKAALAEALPDLPFWHGHGAVSDPAAVRYVTCWKPPENLFDRYPNIEVLISVGAGADQFDQTTVPPHVRITRMITPGITTMMMEYVTMGVIALNRDLPRLIDQQKRGHWHAGPYPQPAQQRVGVMGLGQLGQAALKALAPFGYQLAGWSRSSKRLPGVACYAGPDGLTAFLAEQDIVVCLLPLTPGTQGILNADLFGAMKPGARLLHCGRGAHLDQDALMSALEGGQLSAAMLDVTTPEPLPQDHPLWAHPKVLITPHIATQTDDTEGAACCVRIVRAHLSGDPIAEELDRAQGY